MHSCRNIWTMYRDLSPPIPGSSFVSESGRINHVIISGSDSSVDFNEKHNRGEEHFCEPVPDGRWKKHCHVLESSGTLWTVSQVRESLFFTEKKSQESTVPAPLNLHPVRVASGQGQRLRMERTEVFLQKRTGEGIAEAAGASGSQNSWGPLSILAFHKTKENVKAHQSLLPRTLESPPGLHKLVILPSPPVL